MKLKLFNTVPIIQLRTLLQKDKIQLIKATQTRAILTALTLERRPLNPLLDSSRNSQVLVITREDSQPSLLSQNSLIMAIRQVCKFRIITVNSIKTSRTKVLS
jgi:hypothetical protein